MDDDDEYEYESDLYEEAESPVQEAIPAVQATVAAAQTPTQQAEETDWVMGSDGYWWYHDKVANEWWYKNAEGEIVQHK